MGIHQASHSYFQQGTAGRIHGASTIVLTDCASPQFAPSSTNNTAGRKFRSSDNRVRNRTVNAAAREGWETLTEHPISKEQSRHKCDKNSLGSLREPCESASRRDGN